MQHVQRVAVGGPRAAGKSCTVNAILGVDVLPEREPLDREPRHAMPVLVRPGFGCALLRVAAPLPLRTFAFDADPQLSAEDLDRILDAVRARPEGPPPDTPAELAAQLAAALRREHERGGADDGLLCFVVEVPSAHLHNMSLELVDLPPWDGGPLSRAGLATQVLLRSCTHVQLADAAADAAGAVARLRRYGLYAAGGTERRRPQAARAVRFLEPVLAPPALLPLRRLEHRAFRGFYAGFARPCGGAPN